MSTPENIKYPKTKKEKLKFKEDIQSLSNKLEAVSNMIYESKMIINEQENVCNQIKSKRNSIVTELNKKHLEYILKYLNKLKQYMFVSAINKNLVYSFTYEKKDNHNKIVVFYNTKEVTDVKKVKQHSICSLYLDNLDSHSHLITIKRNIEYIIKSNILTNCKTIKTCRTTLPSLNITKEFKWGTVFNVSGENPVGYGWQPSEHDIELLNYFGDEGFLFANRHGALNFGVRIKGAKGKLPFIPPINKEGSYVSAVSLEDGDDILLMNAQHWSLLRAYSLGFNNGIKYEQTKN